MQPRKLVKVFDSYTLKELLFPFFIALSAFVIIGLVDIVFSLLDYLVNRGVSVSVIFKLLLLKIPSIVVLFLPLATLFSVMLSIFKSIKDNEMMVLWTSGIRYERIFLPVIVFAISVTALAFYLGEYLIPYTNYKSNNLIHRIILKESIPDIEENTFFKDTDNRYFYIKKVNKKLHQMEGVMLYELQDNEPRVILADQANWNDKYWTLINGKMHKFNKNGFLEFEAVFKNMTIKVNYDMDSAYQKIKNTREMGFRELKQRIDEIGKAGLDTKALKVEYFLKFAFPFTNFIFALIGVVIIFIFVKSAKDMWGIIFSIITSLILISLFFFLTAFFRALGLGGLLPPVWSAWIPNLIFSLCFFLLWAVYRWKK